MANVAQDLIGSIPRAFGTVSALAEQLLVEPKPVFALIGAGLSCAVNGPTWGRLLDAMGEQLGLRAKSQVCEDVNQYEQFQRMRRERNLKGAGEVWKWSRIHYEEKQRLLNNLFANLDPGTLHRDLISCGLRGILTLNYDHLLEDAYAQITGRSITPFIPSDLERQDFFFGDDFFIAKLHGDAARWESIVVGDTDYSGAAWPKKARLLVGGHTLLVLGISLQDSIVNEFLAGLPANTRVHVIMPASEAREYRQWCSSLHNNGIPGHVSLHPLEHRELPLLIHALKPPIPANSHIDCSWSDLPPSGYTSVDFGQPAGLLRAFLLSDKRLAHVESQPGWGLSSFLAQILADRARAGDAIVVRMEAKEWLCWDKYVLQLLAKVNGLLEKYKEMRAAVALSATAVPESHTIALALQALGRPVIICVEQAHRLQSDAIDAIQIIISESQSHVKVILSSSHSIPTTPQTDTMILLSRPQFATLASIAEKQRVAIHTLERVLELNGNVDLNLLVMAGALLKKNVNSPELLSHIHSSDLQGVCSIAVQHMTSSTDEDEHLLRALKICVIFQSQRTPEALKACFASCTTMVATDRLQRLAEYGLVIADESQTNYTMSDSIRSTLKRVIPWDNGEFEELSQLVGHYLLDVSFREIEEHRFDRKVIYNSIPGVAEAIEHFRQAGDRSAYLNAVDRISVPLIQMCHHKLVGIWLDACPATNRSGKADVVLDWKLAILRTRLAVTRSETREQRTSLAMAEEALQRLKEAGNDIEKERGELNYYFGTVAESHRDHVGALKCFQDTLTTNGASLRRVYDVRLRIVQSLLSLGKLSTAERHLDEIHQDLVSGNCNLDEADRLHCESLIASRTSKLATLRLQLFELRPNTSPITKEFLLDKAMKYAEDVRRSSERLERTDARRGRPDKIGIGLGYFLRSEAHFAGRNFAAAHADAKGAAGMLGAYVNSSWWLVMCHELAARSLALLGDVEGANRELKFAQHRWDESHHEDPIRDCEFKFTEGLIALKQGAYREAVDLLEQSLASKVFSPCIEAVHIDYFIQALALDQQTARARLAVKRFFEMPIEW